MGDPSFGLPDYNTIDDHILDCLILQNAPGFSQLVERFEAIIGETASSKQQVALSMALDGYLGGPSGYYEKVLQHSSVEWVKEFVERMGITQILEVVLPMGS